MVDVYILIYRKETSRLKRLKRNSSEILNVYRANEIKNDETINLNFRDRMARQYRRATGPL